MLRVSTRGLRLSQSQCAMRRYRNAITSEFLLCDHFKQTCEPKSQTPLLGHWPDLWGYPLTWDFKFGNRQHAFLHEALSQLGVKRRGCCTRPPLDRTCRKPNIGLVRMLVPFIWTQDVKLIFKLMLNWKRKVLKFSSTCAYCFISYLLKKTRVCFN